MPGTLVSNIEMKHKILIGSLIAGACAALFVTPLAAAALPRDHLSLDAGWKFHLGDDWPGALRLDKAGTSSGPASDKLFSDAAWRTVNLPHDWVVELPFDRSADMSHGFKPVGPGFENTSIGWYRRTFELSKEDEGKRIWLTFDGVFRDATVWVNGWLVRRHEGGYYPFREDITDVVKFGGRNVVAVRVDATKFEGWFTSTVRHNMARGTHQVELSAKLDAALKKHKWTNQRIGMELGMDPDEVLRLKQITGLAEAFKDKEFSKSWE